MSEDPFEVTVISGKGGTGKTTICAAFGFLEGSDAILCDLDVDASNLPLIMSNRELEREPFTGLDLAKIDIERCSECGLCVEKCRFNAITENISIIRDRCEGCGVCHLICPENAIDMIPRKDGFLVVSETERSVMVHGDLLPGGEGSGKLVSMIRERGKKIAKERKKGIMITDGPPGIGCPVISSLTGADLAVIVTEPSVSGISDLSRVMDLCSHFNLDTAVIINKSDIDPASSVRIEEMVKRKGGYLLGKLPFDREILDSLQEGITIVERPDSKTGRMIENIWEDIKDRYIN